MQKNHPARIIRHAFTLVELLVVISIVALLIAILLPALQKARTVTHMSVSLSNVRQITLAILNYANDNKSDLILEQWISPDSTTSRLRWCSVLVRDGYLTSRAVLWSPAKPTGDLVLDKENWSNFNPWRTPGYGINNWISKEEGDTIIPYNFSKQSKIVQSKAIILTESFRNGGSYYSSGYMILNGSNGSMSTNDPRVFTYAGNAVRSYLDGHAEANQSQNIHWQATSPTDGYWTLTTLSSVRVAPWYRDWR